MKGLLGLILIMTFPALDNGDVHINRIQVIGSHNSYKKAIDPALFGLFQKRDSVSAGKIDYEHVSLTEQLEMGLLNLEIDVYADPMGGKYAHPKGLQWAPGQPPFDPAGLMNEPGFKVLHIPDLDFRSDCLTLRRCLSELKAWSVKHPDHPPVFITMEPKDGESANKEMTAPDKFTSRTFDMLDSTLLADLGADQLVVPDMVRGKYKTLEDAVLHDNWPTLKTASGRFLIVMDGNKEKRDIYIEGHPSLKGRVLFVNANPGTPEAAMMIRNNPHLPEIKNLVEKGYIIRTRADSDTKEARLNDRSGFEAACASGAQIITTDYYKKSTHFKSDYVVSFDGSSKYFRLDPVFNK
jgi:hypothetical protein